MRMQAQHLSGLVEDPDGPTACVHGRSRGIEYKSSVATLRRTVIRRLLPHSSDSLVGVLVAVGEVRLVDELGVAILIGRRDEHLCVNVLLGRLDVKDVGALHTRLIELQQLHIDGEERRSDLELAQRFDVLEAAHLLFHLELSLSAVSGARACIRAVEVVRLVDREHELDGWHPCTHTHSACPFNQTGCLFDGRRAIVDDDARPLAELAAGPPLFPLVPAHITDDKNALGERSVSDCTRHVFHELDRRAPTVARLLDLVVAILYVFAVGWNSCRRCRDIEVAKQLNELPEQVLASRDIRGHQDGRNAHHAAQDERAQLERCLARLRLATAEHPGRLAGIDHSVHGRLARIQPVADVLVDTPQEGRKIKAELLAQAWASHDEVERLSDLGRIIVLRMRLVPLDVWYQVLGIKVLDLRQSTVALVVHRCRSALCSRTVVCRRSRIVRLRLGGQIELQRLATEKSLGAATFSYCDVVSPCHLVLQLHELVPRVHQALEDVGVLDQRRLPRGRVRQAFHLCACFENTPLQSNARESFARHIASKGSEQGPHFLAVPYLAQ
mmetsp:Transcript_1864/g.2949  ORF Transcript_1864/g.2949 Transcript_1864/m.2949 type:complete len:556 (+) Transcript_1864:1788-3455(+)